MNRNTHAAGINSLHSRCKFVSSSISRVMRECFCADVWGVIDTESQRVPLCSPMHLPEASRCSYCDLWPLNALCFPFVAPPTPGRRRVQVSGCCSAVPGRTGGSYKGFFFGWGGGEMFIIHLFSMNSSSMGSSRCIETCAHRMKMRRKWDEITYLQQVS